MTSGQNTFSKNIRVSGIFKIIWEIHQGGINRGEQTGRNSPGGILRTLSRSSRFYKFKHSVFIVDHLKPLLLHFGWLVEHLLLHWQQQCVTMRHVPNCMSFHKAIVVITGRAHCFHNFSVLCASCSFLLAPFSLWPKVLGSSLIAISTLLDKTCTVCLKKIYLYLSQDKSKISYSPRPRCKQCT